MAAESERAARGLPESRAAAGGRWRGAGGTREPASELGRGGGGGGVARTENPRAETPSRRWRKLPQLPRSHRACALGPLPVSAGRQERKKKGFLFSRDDSTCAEALLTPRSSPCASNVRIGRKLVWPSRKLPSDRFNTFAAPAR